MNAQTIAKTDTDNELAAGMDLYGAFAAGLDASEKTRATYTRALRSWAAWLAENELEPLQVVRAHVLEYKRDMMEGGKSAATVNLYLAAVRAFYRWTEAERIYPNVAAGIKGAKTAKTSSKDALTVEQARRLVSAAGDSLEELRDAAMLNLMVRRGLRTIEVARANVGDIRQVACKAVLFVQGKGRDDKGEFVVLGEEVLAPIYRYLEARGKVADDAPLFAGVGNRNRGGRMTTRNISRIAKQHMAAAGFGGARLTAHSLRHTAVTFALMGGASVQEAQAMARHSNIATTMVYAHNLQRANAAAERAVDAFLDAAGVQDRRNAGRTTAYCMA